MKTTFNFMCLTAILLFTALSSCSKKPNPEPETKASAPKVTTSAVTVFTQTTASFQAEVTDDGGSTVTERGFCWSLSPNPGLSDSVQKVGAGKGLFSFEAKNLSLGTTYYLRAYAVNAVGTSFGNEISFTTDASLALGLLHSGGYIFYLDSTKLHGLVVSDKNVADLATWGCPTKKILGAQSDKFGDGLKNTLAILADCTEPQSAANLCKKYTGGGFNDWYLPTSGEMMLINQNVVAKGIGGFTQTFYWTSTQSTASDGFVQIVRFSDGGTQYSGKTNQHPVRAIRNF